jgi:cyanate permease
VVGLAGIAVCVALLPGALRRRDPMAGFLVAVLTALLAGAAITGGLSTPHDRYQSRLMWLPPCIGILAIARRRSRAE